MNPRNYFVCVCAAGNGRGWARLVNVVKLMDKQETWGRPCGAVGEVSYCLKYCSRSNEVCASDF